MAGHLPAGARPGNPAAAHWWQIRNWRRQKLEARRIGGGSWDWAKFASAVTALTAIAALLFTGLSLQQTREQNQLAESGQITDRFNAAVTNLGSGTETIRIGGIYALQRIMQDSPRDQSAVIQVLTAFVRERAPRSSANPIKVQDSQTSSASDTSIDVQAALTVLSNRNAIADQDASVDLDSTNLVGADLLGSQLDGSSFVNANLSYANLDDAKLVHAILSQTNLTYAGLNTVDLSYAFLAGATLTNASMFEADLASAQMSESILSRAYALGANFTGADLSRADLTGANLSGANLTDANLSGANLTGAIFTDAILSGANLYSTSMCNGVVPTQPSDHYVCDTPPVSDGSAAPHH